MINAFSVRPSAWRPPGVTLDSEAGNILTEETPEGEEHEMEVPEYVMCEHRIVGQPEIASIPRRNVGSIRAQRREMNAVG